MLRRVPDSIWSHTSASSVADAGTAVGQLDVNTISDCTAAVSSDSDAGLGSCSRASGFTHQKCDLVT